MSLLPLLLLEPPPQAQLEQVYETFTPSGDLQQLTLKSTLPQELVQYVGAPEALWTVITCPEGQNNSGPLPGSSTADVEDLQVAVVWQNKTPTRLPEALWLSFQPSPDVIDVDSWRMHKLGSLISPTEVSGEQHSSLQA